MIVGQLWTLMLKQGNTPVLIANLKTGKLGAEILSQEKTCISCGSTKLELTKTIWGTSHFYCSECNTWNL